MSAPADPRIETVRDYFRKVDAKDPSLIDLFTDDVEFFFPKFGTARGKAAVARFGERIAQEAARLTHDIDGFVFTVEENRVVVEGREWGVTADGREWPDGEVSQGRFANVFEFDGPLISRTYIYVDPDVTSDDARRIALYREGKTVQTPQRVAELYLERVAAFLAAPEAPGTLDAILDLFADDVDWDIPGDLETVSWIGPRRDREGVAAFFRELAERIEPRGAKVRRILADEQTAVVLGDLESLVRATGKLIQSPFAYDLTVQDDKIVRYRMLEDSHAVARAAA
ncbi:nuclear transport factor 2 family protein [Aureimonas altamirensis]|uniref:nuclear transport factor 2 family protein n=1 Tax=Aureimonas altamirensis TaxID=370622 RepID=UPI0020367D1F|nr:nuclear transport factor 2 family protein [Aureimonas altamirensis]MCM2505517.1 nuclear transport factor 2 family protein [Aureimonas altamirensis]